MYQQVQEPQEDEYKEGVNIICGNSHTSFG